MVTISISKVSVVEPQPKMYAITLNLKVEDGEEVLIDQNFTENHKIGNSIEYTINRFKEKMQMKIDKYKNEQDILNSVQLDSAILTLEGNLTWQ